MVSGFVGLLGIIKTNFNVNMAYIVVLIIFLIVFVSETLIMIAFG